MTGIDAALVNARNECRAAGDGLRTGSWSSLSMMITRSLPPSADHTFFGCLRFELCSVDGKGSVSLNERAAIGGATHDSGGQVGQGKPAEARSSATQGSSRRALQRSRSS